MKLQRIFLNRIEDWSKQRPLSILGATGSGKTSTLLNFLRAQKLSPLLVSLDSITAYKELDIGSSKPLGEDYSSFEWSGLSFVSPLEVVNASVMRDEIMPRVSAAIQEKRPIVFVGGTHFYERFILEGAAPGAASDPIFIEELARKGRIQVHSELSTLDPRWGSYLHINDEYRIFRYADLVQRQGFDYDTLRAGSQNSLFPQVECLIMNSDKAPLELKLKKRIQEMLDLGWIRETENLLQKYGRNAPALASIGYAEIVEFLDLPLEFRKIEELKESVLIRHRQLAKQQRTWLKKLLSLGEVT